VTDGKKFAQIMFLLSTWNMESIGFTCKKIIFNRKFSRFRNFYTEKTSLERKKIRLSRGFAVGFWTKFEAQLA
jgi:hypothetical protein